MGTGGTGPLPEGGVNPGGCLMHSGRRPSQGQGFSIRVLGDTTQEMEKIKRHHITYSYFVTQNPP